MADLIGGIVMIVGTALIAVAGAGSLRFGDIFNRMHAATKASTLGILLVATGACIRLGDWAGGLKLFVAVSLIFITAPIAAHLVGRAAYPNWRTNRPPPLRDDLASRNDSSDEINT